MQRIYVFTGSNRGARPEYVQAAQALGLALVRRKLGLVNGVTSAFKATRKFGSQAVTNPSG